MASVLAPASRRLTGERKDVPDSGRERGMTLVELLVSMTVFGLCMAVVVSALVLVMRKSQDVQGSADAATELRLALAQIDKQVRSGNVLFTPAHESTYLSSCTSAAADSGTCMRIFTQANGTEKCVQWQVTDDPAAPGTMLLRSRSWASTWQTDGNYTTWTTVARNLRTISTRDPFQLQGATTPYRERLLSVRLDAFDSRRQTTVNVESSLSGRNTTYGFDANQCTPVPPA